MNAAGQGGLLTAGRLAYLHAPDEGDGEEEDDDEEGEEGEDVEAAPQVSCIVVSYVAPAGRRSCRGTVHMSPPHHVQLQHQLYNPCWDKTQQRERSPLNRVSE